jgi:hypothetical protein
MVLLDVSKINGNMQKLNQGVNTEKYYDDKNNNLILFNSSMRRSSYSLQKEDMILNLLNTLKNIIVVYTHSENTFNCVVIHNINVEEFKDMKMCESLRRLPNIVPRKYFRLPELVIYEDKDNIKMIN